MYKWMLLVGTDGRPDTVNRYNYENIALFLILAVFILLFTIIIGFFIFHETIKSIQEELNEMKENVKSENENKNNKESEYDMHPKS